MAERSGEVAGFCSGDHLALGHSEAVRQSGAGLRILVVEDDELILDSLAEVLGDAGFETVRSPSAENALTLLNGEGPEILVTDINLGAGMDGLALGRAIRAKRPDVAVVYISGRYAGLSGLTARERFMAKPFGAAALLRTIDEVRAIASENSTRSTS